MENGTKGELVYTVQESDLADRVALDSEDQFPRVFVTDLLFFRQAPSCPPTTFIVAKKCHFDDHISLVSAG